MSANYLYTYILSNTVFFLNSRGIISKLETEISTFDDNLKSVKKYNYHRRVRFSNTHA